METQDSEDEDIVFSSEDEEDIEIVEVGIFYAR